MPTNLDAAVSKLLHPSNSKKIFTEEERSSIQTRYPAFPMVDFLREELDPEFADDEHINPLHSLIIDVILNSEPEFNYQGKYKYLVDLLNAKEITVDEFMHYGRTLSRAEARKQVVENPGTTGENSKLPSQSVNKNTLLSSAFSALRGILSKVTKSRNSL